MKKNLYPVLLLLLFSLLSSGACHKVVSKPSDLKDALITGIDQRACSCCGGLMISFNGETRAYVAPFFLIENDPASLGIDANGTFPIQVKVEYEQVQKCNQSFVKIKTLKRR